VPKIEYLKISEKLQYLPDVSIEMQLPSHHSLQDLWSTYCKLILPRVLPIYKCARKILDEEETTYLVLATSIKLKICKLKLSSKHTTRSLDQLHD
jgi:hypothetical protein